MSSIRFEIERMCVRVCVCNLSCHSIFVVTVATFVVICIINSSSSSSSSNAEQTDAEVKLSSAVSSQLAVYLFVSTCVFVE